MKNLREQVIKILSEQTKEGALEEKVSEAFSKFFPQFKLTDGSIKISKIDNTADKISGALKYTIGGMNINSFFIYQQKSGVLVLGEQ